MRKQQTEAKKNTHTVEKAIMHMQSVIDEDNKHAMEVMKKKTKNTEEQRMYWRTRQQGLMEENEQLKQQLNTLRHAVPEVEQWLEQCIEKVKQNIFVQRQKNHQIQCQAYDNKMQVLKATLPPGVELAVNDPRCPNHNPYTEQPQRVKAVREFTEEHKMQVLTLVLKRIQEAGGFMVFRNERVRKQVLPPLRMEKSPNKQQLLLQNAAPAYVDDNRPDLTFITNMDSSRIYN